MAVSINRFVSCLAIGSIVGIMGCGIQIIGGYNFDFRGQTATKSLDAEISDEIRTIEIENKFGTVDVQTTDGAASWSWTGKCWARDQTDANRLIDQLTLEVDSEGDRQSWTVTIPPDDPKLKGVESNLMLVVNPETTVLIRNAHGNVRTAGISKSVELENAHGDVQVENLSGPAKIGNRHGAIATKETLGALTVNCRHGDVVVENSAGETSLDCEHGNISGKAIVGDLTINAEHGSATIETQAKTVVLSAEHCNVKINQTNASFASLTVDAEHGDVTVTLPEESAPQFNLSVEHGRSESEFGSTNGGEAPIVSVETEHGNLSIRKGS